MKVARFTESGHTRLGVVTGDHVADVGHADPSLPDDLGALLTDRRAVAGVADLAANAPLHRARRRGARGAHRPTAELPRDRAQLQRPRRRVGHAEARPMPVVFNKQITCVTGPSGRSRCRPSRPTGSTTRASSAW